MKGLEFIYGNYSELKDYIHAEVPYNGDPIYIFNIHISNEHRGNGYGTALLDILETYALINGCNKIEGIFAPEDGADEYEVAEFYLKNGYRFENRYLDSDLKFSITYVVKDLTLQTYTKPVSQHSEQTEL